MARLDTHWHANPKVLVLGLDGMGLHSWSISYCDAELTDGFIPVGALPQLPRLKQAVNRLVECGRWERVEGGFQLHDYLHYNRSRHQVLTERAAAADRMQRAREVRANNGRSSSEVRANGAQPGLDPENADCDAENAMEIASQNSSEPLSKGVTTGVPRTRTIASHDNDTVFARTSGEVQPLPVPVPVPVPELPTEVLGGYPPTPFGESSGEVRTNGVVKPRPRRTKRKAEPPAGVACCPDFARTGAEHWAYCPNAPKAESA